MQQLHKEMNMKENELKNIETYSQTVGQVTPKQTEESPTKAENSSNKEEQQMD